MFVGESEQPHAVHVVKCVGFTQTELQCQPCCVFIQKNDIWSYHTNMFMSHLLLCLCQCCPCAVSLDDHILNALTAGIIQFHSVPQWSEHVNNFVKQNKKNCTTDFGLHFQTTTEWISCVPLQPGIPAGPPPKPEWKPNQTLPCIYISLGTMPLHISILIPCTSCCRQHMALNMHDEQ